MDRQAVVSMTHRAAGALMMADSIYREVALGIMNDIFRADRSAAGDISTQALLDRDRKVTAVIRVCEDAIVAGMEEVLAFMVYLFEKEKHAPFRILFAAKDGEEVSKGNRILIFESGIGDAMLVERTILNVLQRMSAIATRMSVLVRLIPSSVLLCPTRKGLFPLLDKKACVLGGGGTHRLSLSDAILVKDNHLDALGRDWISLFRNLSDFIAGANVPVRFVEVEVESFDEALSCLTAGSDFIARTAATIPFYLMLDNMSPEQVRETTGRLRKDFPDIPVYFEASGGITEELLPEFGKTGVDVISIGFITNSVRAIDMNMSLETSSARTARS